MSIPHFPLLFYFSVTDVSRPTHSYMANDLRITRSDSKETVKIPKEIYAKNTKRKTLGIRPQGL